MLYYFILLHYGNHGINAYKKVSTGGLAGARISATGREAKYLVIILKVLNIVFLIHGLYRPG